MSMSESSDESENQEQDQEEQTLEPADASLSAPAISSSALIRRSAADRIPGWVPAYFRESIIELTKVTWPARQEAMNLTGIVVAFVVVTAVVFGLLDLGFYNILQGIVSRLHP